MSWMGRLKLCAADIAFAESEFVFVQQGIGFGHRLSLRPHKLLAPYPALRGLFDLQSHFRARVTLAMEQ